MNFDLKKLLFLIILFPLSLVFAVDLGGLLMIYKIENNFYYSIYPGYKTENILETISDDFILKNKGQINIEKIGTISCDDNKENIQKYHLGNTCQEIQKNIPHVYSYLQKNYQKDIRIFAIEKYIPHGVFLLLLGITYWIITTYSWPKKQRTLVWIKRILSIIFLIWYEIYSLGKQINPVFFSGILFASFVYWYYFILYSFLYSLFDRFFLSEKGFIARLLSRNDSEKIDTDIRIRANLKFLLYLASTIIFIHVIFFTAFPSYSTFFLIYYYFERILGWALFTSILGTLIKNRAVDYIAGVIFLISSIYLFFYGILYYNSQEIVSFFSHFIQTPFVIVSIMCYLISGIAYLYLKLQK